MATVRQRLMYADEVYLYKIPPLSTSGGHRYIFHLPAVIFGLFENSNYQSFCFSYLFSAEDWNLSAPLATCSLLVERQDDQLVLEFRKVMEDPSSSSSNNDPPVFAQSVIDCSIKKVDQDPPQIRHWIEGTVDSSRYFTLRISSSTNNREALIGFGFRDRDQATDLRESLQFYEASMKRDYEATMLKSKASEYSIPRLAEGERIHVHTGKDGSNNSSKKKSTNSPKSAVAVPILLKKPPPAPEPAVTPSTSNHNINEKQEENDDDDWEGDFVSATPSN